VLSRNGVVPVGFRRLADYDLPASVFQIKPVTMSLPSVQRADLHMHSTSSDGRMTPEELVEAAKEGGLELVSLTDHDTLAGWPRFEKAAKAAGLLSVPGVEISARQAAEEVHLVGYGFDPKDTGLSGFLQTQQDRRNERALSFVAKFKDRGLLPDHAALPVGDGTASWARPHIARLLIQHDVVQTMDEAFDRYLTPGSPTFVEKPLPTGAEAIGIIQQAGGIICLAHPGHHVSHAVVMGLIDAGLNGIEVVHPSHDVMLESYYGSLAERYGLLKTGGSDFHARKTHGERQLGGRWFTPEASLLDALRTH